MSRLGKKIIAVPAGTTVTFTDGVFAAKGPKGEMSRAFDPRIGVTISPEGVTTSVSDESLSALWGTFSSHAMNMIEGVTNGFSKKLQIEGIGYKADVRGKDIHFGLGFSHPVVMTIPEGLSATIEKNVITVSGIDKEAVGAFAAKIRDLKKPEPYKGKGIRYEGEVVQMKQGKKSA